MPVACPDCGGLAYRHPLRGRRRGTGPFGNGYGWCSLSPAEAFAKAARLAGRPQRVLDEYPPV